MYAFYSRVGGRNEEGLHRVRTCTSIVQVLLFFFLNYYSCFSIFARLHLGNRPDCGPCGKRP